MTERKIAAGAIVSLVSPLASPLMYAEDVFDTYTGPVSTAVARCWWWTEARGMETENIPLLALRLVATAEEVAQGQARERDLHRDLTVHSLPAGVIR